MKKGMRTVIAKVLALTMLATSLAQFPISVFTQDVQASQSIGALTNKAFETGDLTGWSSNGTVKADNSDKQEGTYSVKLSSAGSSLSQTVTGIPQGSYTVSAWVKGSTSGNSAYMLASNCGGPDSRLLIDGFVSSAAWTQVAIRNVLVYNGQCTITFASGNGTNLSVDNIEMFLDSNDSNPVANWNLENGLTGWNVSGTVTETTSKADTGAKAAELGADSQISQTINVKPNTSYIATVRAKVDRQDVWKKTTQSNYLGKTGELVEVSSYGDRVNLGVKGAGGTVLRQAPSGIEGYCLLTIAFKTGASDNQVTIYANTINDANYQKSVKAYGTGATQDGWTGNGSDKAYVDNFDLFEIDNTIIKGADVSFLPIIEDKGGKYFANGVQQDCLTIMANHGVNAITGMIFVHSGSPIYDQASPKAQQYVWFTDESGNPFPYTMQDGYFDKVHWYGLAERANQLNMGYMPSFHFSDGWMSAAKAFTPVDWMYKDSGGKLVDQSLDEMTTTMYNYVYDFMNGLKTRGIEPMGAKLGNEQDGGIAWTNGKGYSSPGFKALENAAYDATKAVFPNVSCSFHTNNGYNVANSTTMFNTLIGNGVKLDAEAHSLYSGHPSSDIMFMGSNNVAKFPSLDYLNVETGFAVTKYNPDFADESGSMGQSNYYQQNSNGQYNWLLDYMQAHRDIANPYSRMRGFFYWAAEWIVVEGAGASTRDGNTVDRRTLFNNGDPNFHEMGSTADGKMGDMTDGLYAYLWRGFAKDKTAAMQTPLKAYGDYSIAAAAPTGISLVNPSDVATTQTTLSLTQGETKRLLPKIEPSNGILNWNVKWSSSDPSVATVDKNGFVTALKAGQTDITVTTIEGSYSAACAVTVNAATTAGAGNLALTVNGNPVTSVVNATVWDKIKLKAVLPTTTTNKVVKFVSSNPDVAAFLGENWQSDNKGTLYQQTDITNGVQLNVKNAGTAVITATSADGTASAQFTLNTAKIPVDSVSLNESSIKMSNGRTHQLTTAVLPSTASFPDVKWTSSNTSVAKVDDKGLVTAVGIGTAVITVKSVDDATKYAECSVEVVPVMVEGLELDKTKLNIMINTEKSITAIITPSDADNKTVNWVSSDATIAKVDSNGKVTGLKEGTTTITATAADTSNGTYSATCTVTVQTTPVNVTGVSLNTDTYYFASDYFSATNISPNPPTTKLLAQVAPLDATNDEVVWSSDNTEVATVDQFGKVTALKGGNATITATTADGNYTASCKVMVPVISESFDNRALNDNWSVTVGSATTNTAAKFSSNVTSINGNQVLSLQCGGNGLRAGQRVFANPIINGKVILDFDWNVGAPTASYGCQLSIEDSSNNRYLTLESNAGKELTYGTGGQAGSNTSIGGTKVGTGFNVNNATYNVRASINFITRTIDLAVTNKADTSITTEVKAIPFNTGTAYTNNVAKIQFVATKSSTMSWATWIDNFNAYVAAPIPKSVTLNKTYLHLLNVSGTSSNTAQLSAVVNPNVADISQDVIWSSSDTSIATVSSTGLVTGKAGQDGTVTITATSVADSSLSASCNVKVEGFYPMETLSIYSTKSPSTGIEDTTVNMNTGDKLQLYTGTSNDCFIDTIDWQSSDSSKVYADKNGVVYAIAPGKADVLVTVDNYSSNSQISGGVKLTKKVTINVSGDAILSTFELESAINKAIAAKTYADDYYTSESLNAYTSSLSKAQSDLTASKSENWDASHQNDVDQDVTNLNAAVGSLAKSSNISVKELQLSLNNIEVPVGAARKLTYTIAPDYATDKTVTWTSDNPQVADVDQDGFITAYTTGSAVIMAQSSATDVKATCNITVTNDLSSTYLTNGGALSANKSRTGNGVTCAVDNDAATAWSTGGVSSGADWWQIDLGNKAKIDNIVMNFWAKAKYSIEVSENGTDWTKVIDESSAFAGDTKNFTVTMPDNTYGRYIRVNFYGFASGWVGLAYFQANGAFLINHAPVLGSIGNKTVTVGENLYFDVSASDPDGDSISYSADGLPSGAVFNTTTPGAFSWTPAKAGVYQVTFNVSDGRGRTDSESISITVIDPQQPANNPPAFTKADDQTVTVGNQLVFEVSAVDVDSDTLTYGFDGNAYGAVINPASGLISWTPDTAGNYVLTVTVTDGKSITSKVINVKVNPATEPSKNNAPVLNAIGNKTVKVGTTLNLDINATDADGDAITYSAAGLPAGAMFNTTTPGAFSWTPAATGNYTITFTADDGKGGTDSETVTIYVLPEGGASDNGNSNDNNNNSNSGSVKPTVADKVTVIKNNVIVEVADKGSNKADVTLKSEDIKNAISKVEDGSLEISIKPTENTKEVQVELPLQAVNDSKELDKILIDTGFATISFSTEMLKTAGKADKIEIGVTKLDTSNLSESVKKSVGNNPVYDFSLSINGKSISKFDDSDQLNVELNYVLKPGENPNNVVVYYINDNGELEIIKDGKYDSKTGKVKFSPKHFSKYSVAYVNVKFADTAKTAWAEESIGALAARGIVSGTGNNMFKPENNVTRSEFISMLMNAFDLVDNNAVSAFNDVKQGTWYYSAVASAEKLGIITGRGNGDFGVNDKITRQDMAVIAYKVSKLIDIKLNSGSETAFSDNADISAYANEAIAVMRGNDIINGVGGNEFTPKDNSTRAQAAVIIFKLFKLR